MKMFLDSPLSFIGAKSSSISDIDYSCSLHGVKKVQSNKSVLNYIVGVLLIIIGVYMGYYW